MLQASQTLVLALLAFVPASSKRTKVAANEKMVVANEEESALSFDKLVQDNLEEVLTGEWDTDYHALWASWRKVHISLKDEGKFAHGVNMSLQHFSAKSHKFGGSQGSAGTRVITVTRVLPFAATPGSQLADVEERMDLMSAVRHRGRLYLENAAEGMQWTIRWDHGRSWWRHAGKAFEEEENDEHEPDRDDKKKRAHSLSMSLIRQWNKACDADADVFNTPPLNFNAQVGLSLGVGLNMGGFGAGVFVYLCVDPTLTDSRSARQTCLIKQMKDYLTSKADSPENATRTSSAVAKAASMLEQYLQPNVPPHCYPGVCFEMSFDIVPYPPFIWPLPYIALCFNWPLTFSAIRECGVQANTTEAVHEAYDSITADVHLRDATASAKSEIKETKKSAFSLSTEWSQGPDFTFFPVPAVGWWWNFDVTLAMSMRRVVKGLRKVSQKLLGKPQRTKCKADREEYFGQAIKWARNAHDIVSSTSASCAGVRERLSQIQAEHGEVDYEQDPYSLVQHVEQLGGEDYARDDVEDTYLGGGYAYIGIDGMEVGLYEEILDIQASKAYHHSCAPFASFVNTYHKLVAPSHADIEENDHCDVYPLPAMGYQSCRSVDSKYEPDLPAFPTVVVDRHGKVLNATDSQCTRCLQVTSYGMPCNFCSKESLLLRHPTCRQFSGNAFHPACLSGETKLQLNYLDRQGDPTNDSVIRCAKTGGSIQMLTADGALASM